MASKKTLNAKNLEALGAARLAALLLEISAGDAAAKRRLRLELAGEQSPREVAHEVRKRLATIARSRAFVDWQHRKDLVNDLETQRRAITEKVAPHDPAEALDLMWRFTGLAESVFERCDDSSGTVIDIFHQACADLGGIAAAAKPDAEALADRVFEAIQDNGYGQYDGLIETLAPTLGAAGLSHLKARVTALGNSPVPQPPDEKRRQIGWSTGGPLYADEIAESARRSAIRMALMAIADAQGDVDAFVAQYDDRARAMPNIAAEIAQRLLAAGRAEEAWAAINAVEETPTAWYAYPWENARLDVLEALGRAEEAQAFRWTCFERSLSVDHLRDYLRRLPDFEDIEAEERALDHAAGTPDLLHALDFLVSWKALDRAAALVVDRSGELNGDVYEILAPAAEALSGKHPLAATLALRAMIDFTLERGLSSRYRHAVRHLAECGGLARAIEDFGDRETHDAYVARLRSEHGRKRSFWDLVD